MGKGVSWRSWANFILTSQNFRDIIYDGNGLISPEKKMKFGFYHNSSLPIKGAFLVKTKNAFIPAKRAHSVSTNWKISTVPRGSERVPEGAPEHSKRSECSVADRSEQT